MLAIIQYGLSVALVGMGTVFVGLIILIALIKLLEQVLHGMGKKEAAPAQQAVAAEAVEAVEAGAPEAAADDGELIAVIAAAVAAAMEAGGRFGAGADGVCRALYPPHQQCARMEPGGT